MKHDPFSNPFTRRALYRKAHTDPALAAWIVRNDPRYGSRAALSRPERIAEDIITTTMLLPLVLLEGLVGGVLDKTEKDPLHPGPVKRGYEAFKYFFMDPFHRKRALYTLPGA